MIPAIRSTTTNLADHKLFKTLVDENLEGVSKPVGLICSSTSLLVVGNPLQQISYGDIGVATKPIKHGSAVVNSIKSNCADRFVAFASSCLSIFDLEKESVIRELHEHNGEVSDVAWHRTSPYQLASVSKDCTLRMWDVRSHPAQVSLRRVQRPFQSLQYSPDCSFIGCAGESITIFDLNAAQSTVHIGCGSTVNTMCFNPAECLLATASEDRVVRFWDVDTGECVTQSLPFETAIHRMEFHPEGKYLVVSTSTHTSTVGWEPFELLSQIRHSLPSTTTNVLDISIYKEKLMQLAVSFEATSSPSLKLSSISLAQLEKCSSERTSVDPAVVDEVCQSLTTSRPRPNQISQFCSNRSNSNSSSIVSPSSDQSGELTSTITEMVYLPSASPSATTTSSSATSNPKSSLSNLSNISFNTATATDPFKITKKCLPALKSPSSSSSFKLKQSRSRSCSTKSLNNNNANGTLQNLGSKQKQVPIHPMSRRQSSKSERESENTNAAASSTESDEISKLCAMIKLGIKIKTTAKRRKMELGKLLNVSAVNSASSGHNRSDGIAAAELLVNEASKHDESMHLLAKLLKAYLQKPKCYSLGLNAIFLDKVRVLFSHHSGEYLALALELLEMVVHSFGDSIRHGLSSKNFSIGVDVAAEERFERCNKCRNALMQVQLSSSFLVDRLKDNGKQEQAFQAILVQLDRILGDN